MTSSSQVDSNASSSSTSGSTSGTSSSPPSGTSPNVSQAKHRKKNMYHNQVYPSPEEQQPQLDTLEPALVGEPVSAERQHKHPFSKTRIRVTTAVFTLIAALLFADQNLLSPSLSQAAEFFGFDETQKDVMLGGYVNAAFFAIGAPAALLIGWLADRYNRRNMLFIVAIIGQVPCLCTIFVTKYWQFLLTRMITGISVGGAFPLLYSLLGDMFPISQRAFVSSFIQIATGAGVFLGQMIAAWVAPATDWRMPFVVVAAPSIACSVLMLIVTKEPPRGACEEALQDDSNDGPPLAYSERITWPKLKTLMKVPSNWLIVWQGLPGSITWGVFNTYFNDYLQIRNDWDTGIATLVITIFGVGAALGVLGGGYLGQRLYNKKKEWSPLFAGACVLIAIGPFMFLINMELKRLLGLALVVAFIGGMFGSVAGPNVKAMMLNVNDPEARGVALALSTMTDDVGKALGPFIVAGFISMLGRQSSFNIAVCGSVPAGIMIMSLYFYIRKDEARVQDALEEWKRARDEERVVISNGEELLAPDASVCSHSSHGTPGGFGGVPPAMEQTPSMVKLPEGTRDIAMSVKVTDSPSIPRHQAVTPSSGIPLPGQTEGQTEQPLQPGGHSSGPATTVAAATAGLDAAVATPPGSAGVDPALLLQALTSVADEAGNGQNSKISAAGGARLSPSLNHRTLSQHSSRHRRTFSTEDAVACLPCQGSHASSTGHSRASLHLPLPPGENMLSETDSDKPNPLLKATPGKSVDEPAEGAKSSQALHTEAIEGANASATVTGPSLDATMPSCSQPSMQDPSRETESASGSGSGGHRRNTSLPPLHPAVPAPGSAPGGVSTG